MHQRLGDTPQSPNDVRRSLRSAGQRTNLGRSLFTAGRLFILVAAVIGPVIGALLDSVTGRESLGSSIMLREAVNLLAALAAIGVLHLLTGRPLREITRAPAVIAIAVASLFALAAVRCLLQIAVGLIDTAEDVRWLLLESSVWVVVMPMMATLLVLVMLRERIINAQTILLDESRHALLADHESLRARVFDHLHGTVQSELVVSRVRLSDLAQEMVDDAQASTVRSVAERLRHLQETEVRRLAHGLAPAGLDSDIEHALQELAASVQGLAHVSVVFDPLVASVEAALEAGERAALRLTIYRIVEECVGNALRHAGASHIDIRIMMRQLQRRAVLDIDVTNDIRRETIPSSNGAGLRVMRARAAGYDGEVTTEQDDGRFHTHVTLLLASSN